MSQPRVLMLGWEYPPRFAGGLGKACEGLATALARSGVAVTFVLPRFDAVIRAEGLEVGSASDVIHRAGRRERASVRARSSRGVNFDAAVRPDRGEPSASTVLPLLRLRTSALLHPYAAPVGQRPSEARRPGAGERGSPRDTARSRGSGAPARADAPEAPARAGPIYGEDLWGEVERFARSVRTIARARALDLVHAHDWMTFPAAFEFGQSTGRPVCLHVHATEYDRAGPGVRNDIWRIEVEAFRRADRIFAVSRYTAGVLAREYGVDPTRVTVVHNAPEPGFGSRGGGHRRPEIVFVGRITRQKGPEHLVGVAARVARACPEARFRVCGEGDLLPAMRDWVRDAGLTERFEFLGFRSPAEVRRILRRASALLLPSVSEPFGLVALEALQCGIPVLLSRQCGAGEVLGGALRADFWDHDRLAEHVIAALRMPHLARALVSDGRRRIQRLSWDDSASRSRRG